MNNEEKLKMMKLRVLRSFKWEKDIIIPLSEEFGLSKEEFEDILMDHFDMSDLQNIHATFEIANRDKLKRQLFLDLRLYWFADVLKLVSNDDADELCSNLRDEVWDGMKYEDALEKGRAQIVELIQ